MLGVAKLIVVPISFEVKISLHPPGNDFSLFVTLSAGFVAALKAIALALVAKWTGKFNDLLAIHLRVIV